MWSWHFTLSCEPKSYRSIPFLSQLGFVKSTGTSASAQNVWCLCPLKALTEECVACELCLVEIRVHGKVFDPELPLKLVLKSCLCTMIPHIWILTTVILAKHYICQCIPFDKNVWSDAEHRFDLLVNMLQVLDLYSFLFFLFYQFVFLIDFFVSVRSE